MQVILDNVGRVDAGIRYVVAVAIVAGAALAFGILDTDWALTAGLGALIVAGYLLMSATVRWDPVYLMLAHSTTSGRSRSEAWRPRRGPVARP